MIQRWNYKQTYNYKIQINLNKNKMRAKYNFKINNIFLKTAK
jgi:hypothetical protein